MMSFASILVAAGLAVIAPGQGPQPVFSNLPLELLGVVLNSGTPSRSVCLIRFSLPPNAIETVGPGEKAFGLAEIRKIESGGVILRNLASDGLEFLAFSKDRPAPRSSTSGLTAQGSPRQCRISNP